MLPSESSCLESLALRNDKGKPAVYDLQSSQWEVEHLCVGGCWLDASVALKSTYSGLFGVASHGFSHLTLWIVGSVCHFFLPYSTQKVS